mmetsp:Transcript_63669/g.125019  ORF Transcript_63669/g.125019 Transcript_63669/m.125019 type:complete len:405 (+) Transcript_63669:111-1325(+)
MTRRMLSSRISIIILVFFKESLKSATALNMPVHKLYVGQEPPGPVLRTFLAEKLCIETSPGSKVDSREWNLYHSNDGLVAHVSACLDGKFKADILQALSLEEEATNLSVRAEEYFGATGINFSPLLPMVALAAQWSGAELVAVDSGSEEVLREAMDGKWLEKPRGNDEEYVDAVDESSGTSLGVFPRMRVHLYNILHRGIGVLVRRCSLPNGPSLDVRNRGNVKQDERGFVFVHQRTAEKRIFPSLFDMFVGGVSAAGEPAEETVRRELKEELNIDVQSRDASVTSAVSDDGEHLLCDTPYVDFLFDCMVSTPLNRCRVSVFDVPECPPKAAAAIRFQETEVQNGYWETRTEVDLAARESWRNHLLLENPITSGHRAGADSELREFVPDGLAVWNAFLEWESMR